MRYRNYEEALWISNGFVSATMEAFQSLAPPGTFPNPIVMPSAPSSESSSPSADWTTDTPQNSFSRRSSIVYPHLMRQPNTPPVHNPFIQFPETSEVPQIQHSGVVSPPSFNQASSILK